MRWLLCLLLLCVLTARADERVSVCFNYGCLEQAEVVYSEMQLLALRRHLGMADDAAQEREALGNVVGLMLSWAGKQSPISADKGGNLADNAVYGKMDCIDHSTTTTRLLHLLERRGWLRYHRVLEPARRSFLLFQHYSAQIEETTPADDGGALTRYVVDSWFFDNGQPAVVMPLAPWLAGGGPNVEW